MEWPDILKIAAASSSGVGVVGLTVGLVFRGLDKSRGALIEDVAGEYQVPSQEIKSILDKFQSDDGKLKALELLLKVPRDRAKDVLDKVKDAAPAVRQMYRQRSRISLTVGGVGIVLAIIALLLPSGTLSQSDSDHGFAHNGDHSPVNATTNKPPEDKKDKGVAIASPVLAEASIVFHTTNNDKDSDTRVTTLLDASGRTIASAEGTYGQWKDNSDSEPISLRVIEQLGKTEVLGAGLLKIVEAPVGHDEWHFNYTLRFKFSDGDVKQFNGSGNVDWDRTTVTQHLSN